MTLDFDDEFIDHDGADVWGVSPESILLGVVRQQAHGSDGDDALRRYYDLEILRTNYDPGWEPFSETIATICGEWFPEPVANAAAVVPPDAFSAFVAGAAYFDTPSGVANLLVHGQEALERVEEGDPVTMPRRDVHGYVDTEIDRRLARSLRIVAPTSDGYRLNRAVFEPLAEGFSKSRSEAAYATVYRVLDHLGVTDPSDVVEHVLAACDLRPPEAPPDDVSGALSVYVRNNALQDLVDMLFGAGLEAVLTDLDAETTRKREQLLETLRLTSGTASDPTSVNWPFSPEVAGVCALASQRSVPVTAGWIAEQEGHHELGVHDELTSAGIDVEYDDGLLRFGEAYALSDGADPATESYTEWVQDRLDDLHQRATALATIRNHFRALWTQQRRRVLTSALDFLETFTVSPTRFIYTIFDPEFHADAYNIDQYVGDSPELEREVREIRRWRRDRPHDADSFAEMIPEVLNHPLESDDVEPVVRIMCPWTNFAIQDYVAQLSRLFDNDVEVKLLFRLPEWREWTQLRQNLLSRLGDTQGNLELRSYTRYKEYHDHGELRELEAEDEAYLSETGVHAKLFVAGSQLNGNLLAGSANLMENSLYYNPEAGIQTRNPNVLETAIEYFDLVWDLAAPDRIPEEAYTGETEYMFFPAVYRPR